MNIVRAPGAPAPLGHYSHAVKSGTHVYLSGILPVSADGTVQPDQPFARQTELVFKNAAEILKSADATFTDVVKVSVYVQDIADWPEFNRSYATIFGTHKPARTVIPVPELHHGFRLEVDLIAELPSMTNALHD